MACSKMSSAQLRNRLETQHQERPPQSWSKTQLLLRIVELEGESVIERSHKVKTPLRELEVAINQAAKKKSTLQQFLVERLGLTLTGNETIPQLRVKAMNQAYLMAPGDAGDKMGFGVHADKSYEDVAMNFPDYVRWARTIKEEEGCCAKMERFLKWAESNDVIMKLEDQPACSISGRAMASSQTLSQKKPDKNMQQMMNKMAAMEKELKELKSQKSRKTTVNTGEDEITSSDWDPVHSAA